MTKNNTQVSPGVGMAVLAENGQDADISVLGQPGCDMSCPYPFVMFACQKLDIRVGALLDVNGAKCQSQDRRPHGVAAGSARDSGPWR